MTDSKEDKEYCENCNDEGWTSEICPSCSGSGEGLYDGSRCFNCKGSGVETIICDCNTGKDFEQFMDSIKEG
jgi:hypothetical protein